MKIILVDAIYAFVIEGQGMFRQMYELLETYPNRKIILTGANGDRFIEYGLDKMLYEVFTLANNPPKSDPTYYKKMLEYFGLTKDDVIYFENNPDAVKSAQSVGIVTYWYDPNKKDLEALKFFLDKNT